MVLHQLRFRRPIASFPGKRVASYLAGIIAIIFKGELYAISKIFWYC